MAYEGEYHADGDDYRPGSDDDGDIFTSELAVGGLDIPPGTDDAHDAAGHPVVSIYVLKDVNAGTGDMAGIVVVAGSAFEARQQAARTAGRDNAFPWAFEVTCTRIGTAGQDVKPGTVLAQFTHG